MIQRDRANLAADEFLAAALLSDGFETALQQLAEAAEAGGATLLRLRNGRPLALLSSTSWAEADAKMIAGDAPPSPRRFFPDHVFGQGFVGDMDVWPEAELHRDPYFQEFLRPRGVFYHAKARLADDDNGERISLSLKRRSSFGPYEPTDIVALDCLLPKLQMAVRVARRVLDSEASGLARILRDRGDPVFELDAWARVLRVHGDETEQLGVVVRGGRIYAVDRRAQGALDQAVAGAVGEPQQPAIVTVITPHGERRFFHVVPVTGRARDVFLATAAVAVLIDPSRDKVRPLANVIRQTLGLTEREAQIATLLAEGLSLPTIGKRLHLGLGTIRNHLKSIFGKTETRRQGELVALLCALRL